MIASPSASQQTELASASGSPIALRKVVIITAGLGVFSVRKGIVELARAFPQIEWMVLEHSPRKSVRMLLRNQWRNVRKNGWRWIPYQASDIAARVVGKWHRSSSPPEFAPGHQYSVAAVLRLARLTLVRAADLHDENTLARVRAFEPDLGVSLAAPVLKASLFAIPRYGTINLHKGKLPDYRGMPPAFWEFAHDAPEVGCTIHRIDSGLDTGPILLERILPRSRFSTVRGMQLALDEIGVRLTCEALRRLSDGTAAWRPQNAGGRTFTKPTLRQVAAMRRRTAGGERLRFAQLCKEIFFWSYVRLARPLAARCLGWGSRQRIVVLLYHRVSDELRDSLTVGVEQFDAQMEWLGRHHQVVSIADVVRGKGVARDAARPVVAVTFDDGYLDNYEHAVPILLRHRIPAAFFVSTGLIGRDEGFPHDLKRLGRALPTMNWDQLREMHALGFVVGSHTVTHLDCGSADLGTVRRELIESRDALKRNLGLDEVIFAYPFGGRANMTPAALQLVKDAGYAGCLSAYGGCIGGPIDAYNVVRAGIGCNHSALAFRAALEGFY